MAPLQDEGIAVNPDALQEENIVTSTMNPEFSRNSGAIVNEVIKSRHQHLSWQRHSSSIATRS